MAVKQQRGFAILLVLWVLAILAALGLSLAASTRAEVRIAGDSWASLQASELAASGYEWTAYLRSRGIGFPVEDFTGLPVTARTRGLAYQVRLGAGTIELRFKGRDRLAPCGADPVWIESFLMRWTGDVARSAALAAAIADWCDVDSTVRAGGAESGFYSSRGYEPRNNGMGLADLRWIAGLNPGDLGAAVNGSEVRWGIHMYLDPLAGGSVNVNFADRRILESIPGLPASAVDRILEARRNGTHIASADVLVAIAGIPANLPALRFLTFLPAGDVVDSIGRWGNVTAREVRRYASVSTPNPATGIIEMTPLLVGVEKNGAP